MTFGRSQAVIATRASRLRLRCRDAVEVGAVGGLDAPGEEGPEGHLDDLVGEQEDGLQFCSQASQQADDLGQVVVDAARDVEVDGEAACFGGHALRVIVEMQWRHPGGEQHKIALGWLEGDGRDADVRLREHSAEAVDFLARGEPVEQGAFEAHVGLEDFQQEGVETLAVACGIHAGPFCDAFEVFRDAGQGVGWEVGTVPCRTPQADSLGTVPMFLCQPDGLRAGDQKRIVPEREVLEDNPAGFVFRGRETEDLL